MASYASLMAFRQNTASQEIPVQLKERAAKDVAQRSLPHVIAYPLPNLRGRRSNFVVICATKKGFGSQPKKKLKKPDSQRQKPVKDPILEAQHILARKQGAGDKAEGAIGTEAPADAPTLSIEQDLSPTTLDDEDFERKLADVKRLTEEQKQRDEAKKLAPIDYDAPLPDKDSKDNILAKVGVGLAVAVFGLLFALGDNVPYFRPKQEDSGLVQKLQLKPDEVTKLQAQVKDMVQQLQQNPDDRVALEGAGVIYAQMGEFDKAAEYLSRIVKKNPEDVEALRLLAEVQAGKGDLDSSIDSYRAALRASSQGSASLLQGLIDTLLAAKKPGEAVGELLAARVRLRTYATQQLAIPKPDDTSQSESKGSEGSATSRTFDQFDPIQVELLLGKSYAAWGKPGDAVGVYDGLIESYPKDFRGYLAKGVLLKDQGKTADAERMFIQARYLAPPEAKATVDKYSGRQAMAS